MISNTVQYTSALLLVLLMTGCGGREAGPSVDELARRQQLRESTAATQSKSLDESIQTVRNFLDDGNLVAAQAELRPLLISSGSNPQVVILAARCEAAEGRKATAAKMMVENLATDQTTAIKSLFLASKWFADEYDFESAETQLRKVLELTSGDATLPAALRAHRQLASLLNNQGRRLAAAKHLQFLASVGAIRERELFAMNTYGDPFIDTTEEKPDFSERLIPAALSQAKVFRHDRDLTSALELTEKLVAKFPQSTGIAAFQGRLYADLHDKERLKGWSSNVPTGIDSEPEYWYAMGILSREQAEHREAVRCFIEAVKRDPTDRFSYLAMAQSLDQLGEKDAAQRVRKRFDLLDEASRLAHRFGTRPGSVAELLRMSELMSELHRDSEAIAWKKLAGIETQAPKATSEMSESFIACELDARGWPLPRISASPANDSPDPIDNRDTRPSDASVQFTDVAATSGLKFQYQSGDDPSDDRVLLHQLTGGGIGVIDLELDGWPDLYLTQGGGDAFDDFGSLPNQLFRNLDGQQFRDVTQSTGSGDTGYGQGVAVADLNQDGFADLVVANIGTNKVLMNQGDGTFTRLKTTGFDQDPAWTTSIACGDLTGDGLPEIVEVNYVDDATALQIPCTSDNTHCNPSSFQSAKDRLWTILANGKIDLADELWFGGAKPGYGFAAIIANIDGEEGNDLFIANDTIENFFWLSQSVELSDSPQSMKWPIQMVEKSFIQGCATGLLGQRQGCMGVASGDFDRNDRIDFHVTNFWDQPADLYLQRDHGFFVHSSLNRGLDEVTKKTVAWGTQAIDFDRNGWLDLAVLNGHLIDRGIPAEPYRMQAQLFLGSVSGFELVDPTNDSGDYWNRLTLGRTMAMLDWNRDSKPDLVCNHLDVPVALLDNRSEGGNASQFELVGVAGERDAIATKVTVTCGDQHWTSWMVGGDGFLCSNEAFLDVGIGSNTTIDHVQVDWPSGKQQRFADIVPNQRYLLIENEDQAFARLR